MTSFEFFGPQNVFIGGWGTKFKFFDLKQSYFNSNGQIRIQTITFKFK
jgi:hypothetical protein